MTTSISPLFQVGLFCKFNCVVFQLKHLTPKTSSLGISKNVAYHFFTAKINGDIGKFVQIPVNQKSTKMIQCLISPSISKMQRK